MTVPYDNYGKGSWKRYCADETGLREKIGNIDFHCDNCQNTGYIHIDGHQTDVLCPHCKPHVAKIMKTPGRTRIVYK